MFPEKPEFQPITDNAERMQIFGELKYVSAPVKGNPENISIQGSWARDNLCIVEVPQLKGITGAPHDGKIQCHRLVADPIRFLFVDLEQQGLLDIVHTWDGMFCPRFIRGSKVTLSNHTFGTAFDINAQWNALGKAPAAAFGCLYDVVPVANKHGFYWGGHYSKRPDGMHFEYSRRA